MPRLTRHDLDPVHRPTEDDLRFLANIQRELAAERAASLREVQAFLRQSA